MGVDFYKCNCCGEIFCDHDPDYEICDCGFEHNKEADRNTCEYCRKETFEDHQILEYALGLLGKNKSELIEEMKNNK